MNIEAARARRRDSNLAREMLADDDGPAVRATRHEPVPTARRAAASLSLSDEDEALLLGTLRDARISPRIHSELNRLILPLMTLRTDAEPLPNAESPVRMFVRQLALLGYRDHEAPLPEFGMIQAMVTRILSQGASDSDSFFSGAEALYALARRAVRRVREQRAGVDTGSCDKPALSRPAEARYQVLIELHDHVAGTHLPLPAQDFVLRLLGPWMMVRYLRYGEHSEPWAEAKAFAALFFDALRPAVDAKEQLRKAALRRQTLAQARTRTERSRAPVEEAEVLLAWLENHFARMDRCVGIARATDEAATDTAFLDALPLPATP